MKYFLILFLSSLQLLIIAQPQTGLVAYYPFENCDAKDVSLNNSDGIVYGDPICDCGVLGNGLYLDGVDDYAALSGNIEFYFQASKFTMSLYFRVENGGGTHDIISKRSNCDFDRSFAVRYTPSSHTLSVDLAEANDKRTSFLEKIDPSLCWIHLVITKDDRFHRIYVNAELVASQPVSGFLDLTTSTPLQIANSPCIGTTDRRFNGYIDELRMYNRVLDNEEIRDLYLGPDRISSRDTTIYEGGSALLKSGTTCANQVSWSPSNFLSDPTTSSTIASPPSTQKFTASYQYGGCTASDTVLVTVINPNDIECGLVPMPNAFSPNNDGRNDAFFISNPFALEVLEAFEIFDRVGNKVFSTTQVSDSWDGTYKGQDLNPGLFLYKIRYTCQGKDQVKTGSVMLIR